MKFWPERTVDSVHIQPAIRIQRRTADETGIFRRQESDAARDLMRLGQAANRHGLDDVLYDFFRHLLDHRRIGIARRNGVDGNTPCLSVFKADCCVLANNHIGDWGATGLTDTLDALADARRAKAGAGRNAQEAARPSMLTTSARGLAQVFAYVLPSSGTPASWAADADTPGVNFLPDTSETSLERVRADIVYGHSSHHPMAVEVHRGRPIFYGCGDFINDYEGIGGHEAYRPDLVLGYVLDIDTASKRLTCLEMLPFRICKFRLNRASGEEANWLRDRLGEECAVFGGDVRLSADQTLEFRAPSSG